VCATVAYRIRLFMERLQHYGATAIRPLRGSRRNCNQCIRIKSHSVILNSILKNFTELLSNVHAVNPKNSFSVKSYTARLRSVGSCTGITFHPHPHTVPGHTVPVPIPHDISHIVQNYFIKKTCSSYRYINNEKALRGDANTARWM